MACSETASDMPAGGSELFQQLGSPLAGCIRSLEQFLPFDPETSFLGVEPKEVIGVMNRKVRIP